MASASDPTPLRSLSNIELFSSTRHSLGIYRSVVITCRYHAPPSSPLDQELFYSALCTIVSAQPMLRVGILDAEDRHACFSHVGRIDLRHHVAFSPLDVPAHSQTQSALNDSIQTAIATVQGQHHDRLWHDIATTPPWRIHVLLHPSPLTYDVVFAFHHALMDGTSGRLFHQQLLAALDAKHPPSSPILDFAQPPALPLGQDAAIPSRSSISFLVQSMWKEFAPLCLQTTTPTWSGIPIDFSLPYHTCILPVTIPAHVLASLLSACRTNGTSLTALLHALVLSSLALNLPHPYAFAASTPINLRPYLSTPTPHTLRSLVSGASHLFPQDSVLSFRQASQRDNLVWHHARLIKSQLTDKLKTLPNDDATTLLHYIRNWPAFWSRKDGQPRTDAWEVSNIGPIEQTATSWRISNVVFSNGSMVAGPALGINVATVAHGPCIATISWQRGVVPHDLPLSLARDLASYTQCFYKTQAFFDP
ncbi:hypothetical protein CDD81_3453 [Ophiocordyceps australis]|uniref:Alcohol acetyltransferase n=1 Tax=Ophiocordyceps australis TaxID=1399860 RepID=A0A2C5Y6E1_9HYPO|nr:hypothetical protein CDD81_3453 [Ophiocordyceps australis]